MRLRVLSLVFLVALSACGKKNNTPTTPTPTTQTPPAPTVSAVAVTLAASTIQVGNTTTATAQATYSDGTKGAVAVTWSSDVQASATVDASGTVRGVAPGIVTISGRASNGVGGGAQVSVIPAGPKTQFGAGTYRVNSEIAAGRYYSTARNGCYWERKSGFGGSLQEIIANDFVAFNADQYIVDIQGSDAGFQTDADCGTWFNSPRTGAKSTITPGIWLVGSQLQAGTYTANVGSGCYWERLSDFKGELSSIISNNFISTARAEVVSISANDTGFHSDGDCGTWTRSSSVTAPASLARSVPSDIQANRAAYRSKSGRLR